MADGIGGRYALNHDSARISQSAGDQHHRSRGEAGQRYHHRLATVWPLVLVMLWDVEDWDIMHSAGVFLHDANTPLWPDGSAALVPKGAGVSEGSNSLPTCAALLCHQPDDHCNLEYARQAAKEIASVLAS